MVVTRDLGREKRQRHGERLINGYQVAFRVRIPDVLLYNTMTTIGKNYILYISES